MRFLPPIKGVYFRDFKGKRRDTYRSGNQRGEMKNQEASRCTTICVPIFIIEEKTPEIYS